MEFQPLVTIVIPVYNGSNFLSEAIESALDQTYSNIEIIVVNDGSNDNGATEKIALSYGNKIRYFTKHNGGVSSALNYGIKKMKGDFFSWLSHDDLFVPNKTELQVEILRNYNTDDFPIIYSDFDVIDINAVFIRKVSVPYKGSMALELLYSYKVNGCTVLIPRKCFSIVGFFDETNPYWSDSKMWFLLAKKFNYHHIPMSLAKTRDHESRDTYKIKRKTFPKDDAFCFAIKTTTDTELIQYGGMKDNLSSVLKKITLNLSKKGYKNAAILAFEKYRNNKTHSIGLKIIIQYYFFKRQIKTSIKKILYK